MDKIVDPLAAWASRLQYGDLPPEVVGRARQLILDAIGCALGASGAEPVRIALAAAGEVAPAGGAAGATLLVTGGRSTADMAAFANGSMVRYLDFNDTYTGQGTVHPSDMLAPAMAVVEACGGSGRDLILGVVLGYEVLCALTDSGLMNHPTAGTLWDQGTFGVVSATAMAARLMRLTETQTAHAISLATCSHMTLGQVRAGEVSHWKGCALANAGRNAILCARLAQKGMTGPQSVFEGTRGFFLATGKGIEPLPLAGGPGAAGQPFRILRARIKPYPSGYFSQSAIEAALELRTPIGGGAAPDMQQVLEQVQSVRLETFAAGVRVMGSGTSRWKPETRESADHSLPYCLAMALLHGEVTVGQYEDEAFRQPAVRDFMARIDVVLGEESERAWPGVPLNVLHVRLRDGTQHTARVSFHVGHYERPMTAAQQDAKFHPLAARCGMPPAQATRLLAALRRLDQAPDLAEIFALATVA